MRQQPPHSKLTLTQGSGQASQLRGLAACDSFPGHPTCSSTCNLIRQSLLLRKPASSEGRKRWNEVTQRAQTLIPGQAGPPRSPARALSRPAGIQAEGLRALPEGTELCTAHSVTNTGGRDGQGRGDQGKRDLSVLPRGSSHLPHLFPKAKLPCTSISEDTREGAYVLWVLSKQRVR